jgi:hypothetical protein
LPYRSEDMLELVAEVRIGDRDPIPLPVPSLLPRLRAWRTGKTGVWGWCRTDQVAVRLCRSQLLLVVMIVSFRQKSLTFVNLCFILDCIKSHMYMQLGRMRQEVPKFEASLGYIVRP